MKKIKSTLGDINGTDSNFTLKRLVNMKPLLSGLEDSDIKKIEQDGTFSDKLHTIAKAPDMSREQVNQRTLNNHNTGIKCLIGSHWPLDCLSLTAEDPGWYVQVLLQDRVHGRGVLLRLHGQYDSGQHGAADPRDDEVKQYSLL